MKLGKLEPLVTWLERKASAAAASHIVPTWERYDYRTRAMIEVANLPTREQVLEAEAKALSPPDERLHVYANGFLDNSRGLRLLAEAAAILERTYPSDISFSVAARFADDPEALLSRNNVRNLGQLSQTDALAQYRAHHAVLTFYDPTVRLNRYMMANKWGDAIAMRTPLILNEGLVTSKAWLDAGAAFAVPFDDPQALADLLVRLNEDRAEISRASKAVGKLAAKYPAFEDGVERALRRLFESPH